MFSKEQIQNILNQLYFPNFVFKVNEDSGDRLYLQISFVGACSKTGEVQEWKGRKWFLSPHMTKSEIVSTAFKAVLTALEHEARENFKYMGRAIYGPHLDIAALWSVATEEHEDTRE